MKLSQDFNKLRKLIKERGYLNSENEINEYYEKNKNEVSILYKARLEYLKKNFKEAIRLITEEYLVTYNLNNNIIYFLALCYLETNEINEMYKYLRNYNFDIKSKKNDEIVALKIYIEKKLDITNFDEYKSNESYLIKQTIKYNREKAVKYNYENNDFLIDESKLKSIVSLLSSLLDKSHKEVSLDIFDKYYFYYPNIGNVNGNPRNAFIVKALRNTNQVIYIEPTTVKTKAYINDFRHLGNNNIASFIETDLENQVNENGLFESQKLIDWLYIKFPYVKSILTYKIQLECALGKNSEALDIIYSDYIPMFGNEPKIFFFIINLLCNVERYEDAYKLLNTKKIDNFVDKNSINKYRCLKLYLENKLEISSELEPNSYIEKQIKNYDFLRTINYILNQNYYRPYQINLGEKLTEEELFDFIVMLDDEIRNKVKTYRDDICDAYYFRLKDIGISQEESTDVFAVLTIKNTNNIIDIFPVTEKNRYRINELGEKRKRVKNKLYLKTKNCKELQNS